MSRLVESIRIVDGKVMNISSHEARANEARELLFGLNKPMNIRKKIIIPAAFMLGLVKCRVEYNPEVTNISFQTYEPRDIKTVKIIINNTVTFPYKYVIRTELDEMYNAKEKCDEIMIIKDGLVTDGYYYNFVFEQSDGSLDTPTKPLLHGTMRAYLLSKNQICPKDIPVHTISQYDKIHLINAMTPLGTIVLNPSQIIF